MGGGFVKNIIVISSSLDNTITVTDKFIWNIVLPLRIWSEYDNIY